MGYALRAASKRVGLVVSVPAAASPACAVRSYCADALRAPALNIRGFSARVIWHSSSRAEPDDGVLQATWWSCSTGESMIKRSDFRERRIENARQVGRNAGTFPPRASPLARRPSPVARRPSPVARRPSPVARRPSPVARRPSPALPQPTARRPVPATSSSAPSSSSSPSSSSFSPIVSGARKRITFE